MVTTYSNFIDILQKTWNYKYHNAPNAPVEPYPKNIPPSDIAKELNLIGRYENLPEILKHADHIFFNDKTTKPFKVKFLFNNPSPFELLIYAKSKNAAEMIAKHKFSDYLKKLNSRMYSLSFINLAISNGSIVLKIKEV